jgi:cytochrome c oxidase subunit II
VPHDTSQGPTKQGHSKGFRALRLAVLPAIALLATGCTGEAAKWKRGGWPAPVTVQGKTALNLWEGSLLASAIVGGLVLGMIIFAAIAFRRRSPDQMPRQVRYNLPIEVLYTFLPLVIVSVLFYFTAIDENFEDKINDKPALQMGVVGFQWSWQFNYASHGVSVTGRPGQPPTLTLPVGEQVHFHLTSPDVIHSFWVIPFLFKRDVIPGHPNEFEVTIDKTGWFQGRCAEYCGIHHDRMLFRVHAVTKPQFQAWLATAQQQAVNKTNDMITTYTGGPYDASEGGVGL